VTCSITVPLAEIGKVVQNIPRIAGQVGIASPQIHLSHAHKVRMSERECAVGNYKGGK